MEAYVLGQLRGSELADLEEHLIVCSDCRDRLDEAENFAAGMTEALAAKKQVAEQPSQLPWLDWLRQPVVSTALALAAVVAIVAIVSTSRPKMAPVTTLTLTANRGGMPIAARSRELDLNLKDSPGEGTFRIEIVNGAGQAVWSGLAQGTASGIQVKTQRELQPGDYFVRLHAGSGEVLHEYGFRIKP